jgi:hypothetical protein
VLLVREDARPVRSVFAANDLTDQRHFLRNR